jgi:ABC-type branched-subunit amino acid transport system ATPase component
MIIWYNLVKKIRGNHRTTLNLIEHHLRALIGNCNHLRQANLIVADGLTGLAPELTKRFTASCMQRCVVHIKRQLLAGCG